MVSFGLCLQCKARFGESGVVHGVKDPSRCHICSGVLSGAQALADSRAMRRAALLHKVPYYTTLSGAVAAAHGIKAYLGGDLEVRALQSYFGDRA